MLDDKVIAELGVLPQRGVLDVVEVLDQTSVPSPWPLSTAALSAHDDLRVIVLLHVAVDSEADDAVGHVVKSLEHARMVRVAHG